MLFNVEKSLIMQMVFLFVRLGDKRSLDETVEELEDGESSVEEDGRARRTSLSNSIAIYSNWDTGEPSSRYEQCLVINSENGKWMDWNCHAEVNVICQKKSQQMDDALFLGTTSFSSIDSNPNITGAILQNTSPTSGMVFTPGVVIAMAISSVFFVILLTVFCWYCFLCQRARRKAKEELPSPIIISGPMAPEEDVESMFSFLYDNEEDEYKRGKNNDFRGGMFYYQTDVTEPPLSFRNDVFPNPNSTYAKCNKRRSSDMSLEKRRSHMHTFDRHKKDCPQMYGNTPIEGHSEDSTRGTNGSSSSSGYAFSPRRNFNNCYASNYGLSSTMSSSNEDTDLSESFSDSESGLSPNQVTPITRPIISVCSTSNMLRTSRSYMVNPSYEPSAHHIEPFDSHPDSGQILFDTHSQYRSSVTSVRRNNNGLHTTHSTGAECPNDSSDIPPGLMVNSIKEQSTIANIYLDPLEPLAAAAIEMCTETETIWI